MFHVEVAEQLGSADFGIFLKLKGWVEWFSIGAVIWAFYLISMPVCQFRVGETRRFYLTHF